jgi:hypothetical protein
MTVLRSACWGVVLVAWGPWAGPVMRDFLARADGPATATTPAVAKTGDKESAKPTPRKADQSAPKFMRVKKDDRQEVVALETSVVRYTADPAKRPGVYVDLIGAIHVGDKAYYDGLNKLFADYDAVLYELVAPEGTRIPKEGRPSGNAHPVGALQNGLKSMLDLDHQLDCVDYTVKNLVHADMSPDEFATRMKERNEGWMQMALRMMGQSAAMQGRESQRGGEAKMLLALFAKDRPLRLKRIMAEQMADTEGALAALDGPDGGSTIISERNKKALVVLDRELEAGKKRLAIFYGAGHLPDFEKRLTGELGYQRGDERWLSAWSLTTAK